LADASQVASQPLGGFLKCLGPDFDLADVLRFVGAAAMVADAVDLLDEVLGAQPFSRPLDDFIRRIERSKTGF
jgi:hypothetical protein